MKVLAQALSASILALSATAVPAAAQDDDALLKRGEYLMNGPVACGNCHNTRAEDMSFVPGMAFAGGFHIVDKGIDAYAANITQDPDTGIGTWTDEEIITAIREGKTPEGEIIFPPMPVPTVMKTAFRRCSFLPKRNSPSPIRLASLSTKTGRPVLSFRISPNGRFSHSGN